MPLRPLHHKRRRQSPSALLAESKGWAQSLRATCVPCADTLQQEKHYCFRPVQACSPSAARSAAASVWLGSRRVSVSAAPVMGLVPLVASHASMACRSYLRNGCGCGWGQLFRAGAGCSGKHAHHYQLHAKLALPDGPATQAVLPAPLRSHVCPSAATTGSSNWTCSRGLGCSLC